MTPLATGLVARPYGGPQDLGAIHDLIRTVLREGDGVTGWHPGGLDWWMATESETELDWSERVTLWEDSDGRLGAWGWFMPPAEIDWLLHPAWRRADIVAELVDRFERSVWERTTTAPSPTGQPDRLTVWAVERSSLSEMLEHRGYEPDAESTIHRVRTLMDPIRDAPPPDGYVVRALGDDAELGARVAVHRAAFAPSRMSERKHRRVMASPLYRRDLDLVAVAPDGEFAGFTVVWYDAATRIAEFEPVGTHPDHQRRGVGRAVMTEGLRRLGALGAERAGVGSRSQDPASNALYESVGFREDLKVCLYRKPLSAVAT